MATYTAANALKKITTGDESGTWGDSTNNNFDIIDRASNGFASIALSSTSYTLELSTTAVLSNGHYKAIKFTGTPGGTCTVTLQQNDKARIYMILNSTNQSLSITQGSGANVTIAADKSAVILADGAGSTMILDGNGNIALSTGSGTYVSLTPTTATISTPDQSSVVIGELGVQVSAQNVLINGGNIALGALARTPVVLTDLLVAAFNTHVHSNGNNGSPTGVPIVPLTDVMVGSTTTIAQ